MKKFKEAYFNFKKNTLHGLGKVSDNISNQIFAAEADNFLTAGAELIPILGRSHFMKSVVERICKEESPHKDDCGKMMVIFIQLAEFFYEENEVRLDDNQKQNIARFKKAHPDFEDFRAKHQNFMNGTA